MPSSNCWLLTWHSGGDDEAAFFFDLFRGEFQPVAHEKVGVALEARVMGDDSVHGGGKVVEIHGTKNTENRLARAAGVGRADTVAGAVPAGVAPMLDRHADQDCRERRHDKELFAESQGEHGNGLAGTGRCAEFFEA